MSLVGSYPPHMRVKSLLCCTMPKVGLTKGKLVSNAGGSFAFCVRRKSIHRNTYVTATTIRAVTTAELGMGSPVTILGLGMLMSLKF